MAEANSEQYFARLTSHELRQMKQSVQGRLLYILPIGNVEVHGPCLPLNTDTLIAEAFANVCSRTARNINNIAPVILPTILYGYSPTTANFAGTVNIPPRILAETIQSIARPLLAGSVSKMVIVNIHGKNELPITLAISEFFDETGVQILYVNPYSAFAKELDKQCLGEVDNSTKEATLLLAALRILGKDDLAEHLAKQTEMFTDKDFPRPEGLSSLRTKAFIPFRYSEEEQHIARRTGVSVEAGRKYYERSLPLLEHIIKDFVELNG